MNEKRLSVHEVARITGVTGRTLRYYDEIGLLKPSVVTEKRYRFYTEEDLYRLQEILFFREIGFALKEIKKLLDTPGYNRREALEKQLAILEAQQERISGLIVLVRSEIKGEKEAPAFEAFSDSRIAELQENFRREAKERWGGTESFREYEAIFSRKDAEEQREVFREFEQYAKGFFERLAEHRGKSPACREVQEMVEEWRRYISDHFYPCDGEMLGYLGELYRTDERFYGFIDRIGGEGTAGFFWKAIGVFCGEKKGG